MTARSIAAWAGGVALAAAVATHALDAVVRAGGGWPVRESQVFVMAALAVGAGVALVVAGVAIMCWRELKWWRLAAIPALVLGLFWSAVPVALGVVATRPAPHESVDLGGLFTEKSVPSAGGADLRVSHRRSSNGATLICLPGSGSTRAAIAVQARRLSDRGYGVVVVDPRGVGESDGRAMGYGWAGGTDVGAVVDWLMTQPDVLPDRVGVLGWSMGGEQALTAAALDPRIAVVVAEGASERTYEDVRRTLGGVSLVLGVPQYRALFGTCELLSSDTPPLPLEEAVRLVGDRPVLLLGTDGEAHYARRYQQVAPGSVMLWVPSSERHTGAFAEDPGEWERRVTRFLDRAFTP